MFASLNFGNPGDLLASERDSVENIRANWTLLAGAIGAERREIVEVHQIHGTDCRVVRRGGSSHETLDGRDTRADALVTDDPSRLIAVRVADCVPVLVASADGRVVASVHAGWRGVIGPIDPAAKPGHGIIDEVLRTFAGLGVSANQLFVAIGPCIGPDQFEVGPEVADAFAAVFGAGTRIVRASTTKPGKFYVDLQAALAEQTRRAGVPGQSIDTIARCTVSEPGVFFSHRRDAGRSGRMVGIIGPR